MEKKLIRKSEQKTVKPDLPDEELERVAGGAAGGLVCQNCGKTFSDTPKGAQAFGNHIKTCKKKP